jgi:hypothetical protein
MPHVVILPYYSSDEVERYLKIAELIKSYGKQKNDYQFLLASSPRTTPDKRLYETYRAIAPTTSIQCPSQVFGYPAGPTAMFWDCMDYISDNLSDDDGFSLWLESDMAPVKADWIDRLSDEWYGMKVHPAPSDTPVLMGCYVPPVYKQRPFRKKKLILDCHINGGACYSKRFANQMPAAAREGVFDMAVFQHAQSVGRVVYSDQITFSNSARVRRDIANPKLAIVHGFMQDKDAFIDQCVRPLTAQERESALAWGPMTERWETIRRQIRVMFVRKGQRAMWENMMLAKQQHSMSGQAGKTINPTPAYTAARKAA